MMTASQSGMSCPFSGAKTVNMLLGPPAVDPDEPRTILHILDCKSLAVSDNEKAIKYPYRFGPAVDTKRIKQAIHAVLGEEGNAGPLRFRATDGFLVFDGRSRKAAQEINKLMSKSLKNVPPGDIPSRKIELFRVHYHNRALSYQGVFVLVRHHMTLSDGNLATLR